MTSSFLSFLFTSLGVENVGEAFAYGILKKKRLKFSYKQK